MPTKLLTDCR